MECLYCHMTSLNSLLTSWWQDISNCQLIKQNTSNLLLRLGICISTFQLKLLLEILHFISQPLSLRFVSQLTAKPPTKRHNKPPELTKPKQTRQIWKLFEMQWVVSHGGLVDDLAFCLVFWPVLWLVGQLTSCCHLKSWLIDNKRTHQSQLIN